MMLSRRAVVVASPAYVVSRSDSRPLQAGPSSGAAVGICRAALMMSSMRDSVRSRVSCRHQRHRPLKKPRSM